MVAKLQLWQSGPGLGTAATARGRWQLQQCGGDGGTAAVEMSATATIISDNGGGVMEAAEELA